tara:strand:+ start:1112 stop:1849 length:738 start_codon:yes stop_codon:yes gene_type:complete
MFDIYFYITAISAVMLFGISKGGFAGPMAILAVPLMSMSISPVIAAGIMLPILIVMDITALYFYWNQWDIKNIKLIIPPSIMGILIGSLTFSYISDDGVRIIIGTIAILFILFTILQSNNLLIKPSKNKGIFWSTIAGYTSFLIHAGGPPLNFYLLPQKMDKTIYVATFTLAFAIINAVKLIPYYFLGQLAPAYIVISLILLPLAPIGIIIGYYLHKKVSEKIFYKFIYIFLAIGGVKLIYDGIF